MGMEDKQRAEASAASRFGRWLRNGVFAALIVLIVTCCYFVYRLSMVAYRMEQSIVAVSADVKQVTSTAAVLSRDVSAIREDIAELKQKTRESVPYEEAKRAMDEALAVGAAVKADSSKLPAASEREISALLKSLVLSPYSAEVGGDKQSIFMLYGWLYGRYRLTKNTLTSTEDFIERVGTKSILGKTYYLVDKEGKRIQLSDWLTERLKEMRGQATRQNTD